MPSVEESRTLFMYRNRLGSPASLGLNFVEDGGALHFYGLVDLPSDGRGRSQHITFTLTTPAARSAPAWSLSRSRSFGAELDGRLHDF